MRAFAARRIEYGRRTGPLTDDDWAVWEAGARRCYEATGFPWPGVVVKVPSPLVGALAPLIAEQVVSQPREGKPFDGAVRSAVNHATRSVLGPSDTSHVDAALREAVLAVIDASPSGCDPPCVRRDPRFGHRGGSPFGCDAESLHGLLL